MKTIHPDDEIMSQDDEVFSDAELISMEGSIEYLEERNKNNDDDVGTDDDSYEEYSITYESDASNASGTNNTGIAGIHSIATSQDYMSEDEDLTLGEEIVELSEDDDDADDDDDYNDESSDDISISSSPSTSDDSYDNEEDIDQRPSQRFEVETVISTQSDATGFKGVPNKTIWHNDIHNKQINENPPHQPPLPVFREEKDEEKDESSEVEAENSSRQKNYEEEAKEEEEEKEKDVVHEHEYNDSPSPLQRTTTDSLKDTDESIPNNQRNSSYNSFSDTDEASMMMESERFSERHQTQKDVSKREVTKLPQHSEEETKNVQQSTTSGIPNSDIGNREYVTQNFVETSEEEKSELRSDQKEDENSYRAEIEKESTSSLHEENEKAYHKSTSPTASEKSVTPPNEEEEEEVIVYPLIPLDQKRESVEKSPPLKNPPLPTPREPEPSKMHDLIDQQNWQGLLKFMGKLRNKSPDKIMYELTKTEAAQRATVLHRVVERGPTSLAKLLVSMVPFESRRDILLLLDFFGNTPLHYACANLKISPSTNTFDDSVITALAVGVPYAHDIPNEKNGDIPLGLLLTSHAMKATADPDLVAIESPAEDLVRKIASERPDLLRHTNKRNQTLLHIAADSGIHERVMLFLLENAEFAASVSDRKGRLPIHCVASSLSSVHPPLRFAERLILASPEALTTPCSEGNTPLHVLINNLSNIKKAENRSSFIVEQLAEGLLGRNSEEAMCPLLIKNREGLTPLHCCAVHATPPSIVRTLSSSTYAKKALEIVDVHKNTPFHILCSSPILDQIPEMISILGTQNSSIMKDAKGRTPMCLGAENPKCNVECMKAIINVNASALKIENFKGRLPLHVVLRKQPSEELVRTLLLAHPKAVKAVFDNGVGIFHEMCQYKTHPDIVELMLHMYPEGASQKNNLNNLPLHVAAAFQCEMRVIKALVKAYPEACTFQNKRLEVPLHYVATHKHAKEVLEYLVKASPASTMIPNENDKTPMDICRERGTGAIMADALSPAEGKGKEPKKNHTGTKKSSGKKNGLFSPLGERKKVSSKAAKLEKGGEEGIISPKKKRSKSKTTTATKKTKKKGDNVLSIEKKGKKRLSRSLGDLNYDKKADSKKDKKKSHSKKKLSSSSGDLGYNPDKSSNTSKKALKKKLKDTKLSRSRSMSPNRSRTAKDKTSPLRSPKGEKLSKSRKDKTEKIKKKGDKRDTIKSPKSTKRKKEKKKLSKDRNGPSTLDVDSDNSQKSLDLKDITKKSKKSPKTVKKKTSRKNTSDGSLTPQHRSKSSSIVLTPKSAKTSRSKTVKSPKKMISAKMSQSSSAIPSTPVRSSSPKQRKAPSSLGAGRRSRVGVRQESAHSQSLVDELVLSPMHHSARLELSNINHLKASTKL